MSRASLGWTQAKMSKGYQIGPKELTHAKRELTKGLSRGDAFAFITLIFIQTNQIQLLHKNSWDNIITTCIFPNTQPRFCGKLVKLTNDQCETPFSSLNSGMIGCVRRLEINDKYYNLGAAMHGGDIIAGQDISK